MTKKEMLDLVISKFGFEAEETIDFAEDLEWMGLAEAEAALYVILSWPVVRESDDDF